MGSRATLAATRPIESLPRTTLGRALRGLPWTLSVLRAAWVLGLHARMITTAPIHLEWPHPPDFHDDPARLTNDPLAAEHPNSPFFGYCPGTFDPNGSGPFYPLLQFLLLASAAAVFAWVPVGLLAWRFDRRPDRARVL